MTRINSGIKPKELSNKLLVAELYEIIRLPTISLGKKAQDIPTFRLGAGHVRFFYDKGQYTLNRYKMLREEALQRGFNVSDYESKWSKLPKELMNDWQETPEAREIVLQRFAEKGWTLKS